ncbi:hypothetical protein UFOVP48_59 [uncultured Caudovirales phage]|uniref:Uncharacterized protein n=1 Tax=uncultured Caudovirales phage TaxID=2100421 RepID=A0A6J5KQY3_9CAUD|nr:hypothetical protein UFOVP48_59 [uncultured Caudovirales phage]
MAITNQQRTLLTPKAPRLPNATPEYSKAYLDQLNNILRLYFNQLDNFEQALLASSGGRFLSAPYGAFQDSTSQTAVVNTATAMKFNTVDFANETYVADGTKLRVNNAGIYNLQFSAQVQNTDNASHDLSIWLRQGNDGGTSVDIPGSTGVVGLPPRKTPTDYFHTLIGWNYFVQLNVDDFMEIYWSTDSTFISIQAYPTTTAPIRPSTASVIATLSFVSALPALQ